VILVSKMPRWAESRIESFIAQETEFLEGRYYVAQTFVYFGTVVMLLKIIDRGGRIRSDLRNLSDPSSFDTTQNLK
jgi:hypothetical protein